VQLVVPSTFEEARVLIEPDGPCFDGGVPNLSRVCRSRAVTVMRRGRSTTL
jgi:hypothetical protein